MTFVHRHDQAELKEQCDDEGHVCRVAPALLEEHHLQQVVAHLASIEQIHELEWKALLTFPIEKEGREGREGRG